MGESVEPKPLTSRLGLVTAQGEKCVQAIEDRIKGLQPLRQADVGVDQQGNGAGFLLGQGQPLAVVEALVPVDHLAGHCSHGNRRCIGLPK